MPLPLNLNSMMMGQQKKPPLNRAALAQAMPGQGAQMFGLQDAPTPGLPQPSSNTVGNPVGNPSTGRAGFTQMPAQEDPGNPPGQDKAASLVTFGFGDRLTTQQVQAIQKALVDAKVGQQAANEKFQDQRVKKIGTPPRSMGLPQSGGSPTPVSQSSPNYPWTGPSSR
jgi:hypothetical protein